MCFHIIGWLVFGLIVGAVARFLVPGRQPMSWFKTALLGVGGSFVGGGISYLLWGNPAGMVNPPGWIMSTIGAVVIILLYQRFVENRE